MSTNAEFFDLVMSMVSRSNDAVSRAFAVGQARLVLQNFDNGPFHPWFLETEASLILADSGIAASTVDLPTDFLDFVEDTDVYLYPASGDKVKLERGHFEDLQLAFINADPQAPEAFDVIGSRFFVGATPDLADYEVRFWYFKKTTAPADNDDQVSNEWILNAEELTACEVAARVASRKLLRTQLASDLYAEASTLRADLFKLNESRKHSQMDYAVNN